MIKFIRKQHGDEFCIGVVGYPEGNHDEPYEVSSLDGLLLRVLTCYGQQCLQQVQEQVDAGAAFVLSQYFFDASVFETFVQDACKHGISVPIIPGVAPIQV